MRFSTRMYLMEMSGAFDAREVRTESTPMLDGVLFLRYMWVLTRVSGHDHENVDVASGGRA